MTLTRRELLRSSAALAASALLAPGCRGLAGRKRPNILWIQTDEQRPDSLGCYGSAWARTPNVDALARRGVVMQNAVCQGPVCVPSRASQLTALYPQECGALYNHDFNHPFPANATPFPGVFRDAGYQVVSLGKSHAPSHDTWDHDGREINREMYAGYTGLHPRYNESYHHVIKAPGPEPTILAGTYPVSEGHPSQLLTDMAITFLRNHAAEQQPFLLRVSHNWPHTPVLPPPPFDSVYDPDELPIRYFDEDAYRTRSQYDRSRADKMNMRSLSRDRIRQIWKDYFGLCVCVDHEVGRLLTVLEETGLTDDTLILYQSDHGVSLGEFGVSGKKVFDSEVWRVPFIWSAPALGVPQGEVRTEVCEILDTGRTLLSLAGLGDRIPEGFRGRNLFGDSARKDVGFGQMSFKDMRVAVRTQRHRLDVTWSKSGNRVSASELDGNLFDLMDDPYERINRFNDPSHASIRSDLLAELDGWDAGLAPYAPPASP